MPMTTPLSEHAKTCLRDEKAYLEERIWACDYCATSYEENQRCRVEVSKEAGARSRGCLI